MWKLGLLGFSDAGPLYCSSPKVVFPLKHVSNITFKLLLNIIPLLNPLFLKAPAQIISKLSGNDNLSLNGLPVLSPEANPFSPI